MSGLMIKTGLAGTFGIIGGAIGYGIGGSKVALEGGKLGMATGTRIAGFLGAPEDKKEEVKASPTDSKTEKVISKTGIDANSQKELVAIAEKTGTAIQRVCEIGGKCIEDLADVWSKMALTGYAISIGFSGSITALEHFDKHCDAALQSINCAAMSATHLSTNALLVCCFICVGMQVYKIATK